MGFGYAQIDTGITIDSQTLEDQTVTLRERDSMQQTRVSLDKVAAFMTEKMEGFVREWGEHFGSHKKGKQAQSLEKSIPDGVRMQGSWT